MGVPRVLCFKDVSVKGTKIVCACSYENDINICLTYNMIENTNKYVNKKSLDSLMSQK